MEITNKLNALFQLLGAFLDEMGQKSACQSYSSKNFTMTIKATCKFIEAFRGKLQQAS